MKTAVDSNVLFDVFLPDPHFRVASKNALQKQYSQGALLVGEVVYSELAAFFPKGELLDGALGTLGIQFIPSDREVCWLAGESWKKYRKGGGRRERLLADFLIAAHSQIHADALLTRDRGFYRKYFPNLTIVEP